MFSLLIIIIASVVLVAIYTLVVHLFASKDNIWGWWHTFIATVISVLLALVIGINLFNWETKRNDDAKRQQLCSLLTAEISDHLEILNSEPLLIISGKKVHASYIQPLILEEAARSGLFKSTSSEKMLKLARQIHLYNRRVENLYASLCSGVTDKLRNQLIRNSIGNIEGSLKGLIQGLSSLQKEMTLDSSISPSP